MPSAASIGLACDFPMQLSSIYGMATAHSTKWIFSLQDWYKASGFKHGVQSPLTVCFCVVATYIIYLWWWWWCGGVCTVCVYMCVCAGMHVCVADSCTIIGFPPDEPTQWGTCNMVGFWLIVWMDRFWLIIWLDQVSYFDYPSTAQHAFNAPRTIL